MPRDLQTPSEPEPGETIIRRTETTTYRHGRAWLPWLAALVLVPLALAWLFLYPFGGKNRIQDDLSAKASAALAGTSIPNAGVRFNGADGVLCGVPDNQLDRAREAVREVGGVNSVRAANAGDTACGPSGGGSAKQPANVTMAAQDGRIVLTGTVPDTAAAETMTQAATEAANGVPVDNQLTVEPDTTMALSAADLGTMAGGLAAVEGNHQLAWNGSKLLLTGTAPDEAGKAQLQEQISQVAPSFAVDNQITVPAGQSTPGTDTAALQQQIDTLLQDRPISFEPDSATLTADGQQTVTAVAALLAGASTASAEIAGHVAAVSSPADGQTLSQERAEAVKSALAAEGISADRLTAQGYGDTQPVASNDTPEGQAANRRVEITVR